MLELVNNPFDKKETKLLQKIAKKTLKMEDQKPRKLEVTLSFVTSEEMKELNAKTRQVDEVTDVLSFPTLNNVFHQKINRKKYRNDVNPATGKVMLGEIVICLEKASEQATEYGHSFNREVCYLFVHGLLHLLGYDHIDELDKNLMRGQEEAILSIFNLKRA